MCNAPDKIQTNSLPIPPRQAFRWIRFIGRLFLSHEAFTFLLSINNKFQLDFSDKFSKTFYHFYVTAQKTRLRFGAFRNPTATFASIPTHAPQEKHGVREG